MSIYANNLQLNAGGAQTSNVDYTLKGLSFTHVCWSPRGGLIDAYDGKLHILHKICSIRDLPSIDGEAINEEEATEAGKTTITTNEGTEFTFTMTMKGGEISQLKAMIGRAVGNKSATGVDFNRAQRMGQDFGGPFGDMFFFHANTDGKIIASTVITDVSLSAFSLPGVTDGESTQEITGTSRGKVYKSDMGFVFIPFIFFDDGTNNINALAPDGSATTFDLKEANDAFATGAVPTAPLLCQTIEEANTDIDKYILNLRGNTGLLQNADYSFDQATGVITATAAPADSSKLQGIICVPSGFPEYVSGKAYAEKQVVRYTDGLYYVASANTGTTWDAADWTSLGADQEFRVPLFHGGDSDNYQQVTNKAYPLISWLDIQTR